MFMTIKHHSSLTQPLEAVPLVTDPWGFQSGGYAQRGVVTTRNKALGCSEMLGSRAGVHLWKAQNGRI